jgi:hypothetical protein
MVKFVKNLTSLLITTIFLIMFIGSIDMHKTATNDFVEAVWALCAIVSFIGATNYLKQDNCCLFNE